MVADAQTYRFGLFGFILAHEDKMGFSVYSVAIRSPGFSPEQDAIMAPQL